MTRCALVTGASGGLGRTLVRRLRARGWEVRATGRRREADVAGYVPADLTRGVARTLLEGADTVFHAAALSAPWGEPAAFRAINVDAVAALLAAARGAGVRRFVHVGTPSIYAEARDRWRITEDDPPAATFANAYAATKWAGERLVLAADAPDLRTVVLRPRAIVRPDDTVLLPRLRAALERPVTPLPGGGWALIELTDARDVADALIAAAEADVGGAINVSGGAPRPLRAILDHVARRLALRPRFLPLPRRAALALGAVGERIGAATGREPTLTRYTAMTLGWSQTFDLARARGRLRWEPRITPEAAIDHALAVPR